MVGYVLCDGPRKVASACMVDALTYELVEFVRVVVPDMCSGGSLGAGVKAAPVWVCSDQYPSDHSVDVLLLLSQHTLSPSLGHDRRWVLDVDVVRMAYDPAVVLLLTASDAKGLLV
tara:strand:- start:1689 stop:2036 length:348 start_codon:yes stop_codon:yes gene_type:complete